jgi:putative aldouronate transport system substrate-binding protein
MKKLLSLSVMVLSSIVIMVACNGTKNLEQANSKSTKTLPESSMQVKEYDPNVPTWKQYAGQEAKFSWYINFSWFPHRWGQDMTSQYITEKTGVNIEYIVPAGNEAEKMNTMIASDTLPDLITLGWYEPQYQQMIDAGLVYSLNELAEQYDPYFFEVADKQKLSWYATSDGNTYGYPNASYSPADFEKYKGEQPSTRSFLVKKDMYEAIGSPDMTTPEGFINALKKAKEIFPTVNGQPLIPLAFNEFTDGENGAEAILQDILAIPYEKDGKLYDRRTDPEYIKWLKVFRFANEEGLLAKDIFIDKRSQMEEKIAQGRYFAMMYQGKDMIAQNTSLYANDPNSVYIAVDGPKNSNGDNPTLSTGGISGWTVTMISKNCKDPARAIQFLSYMISEEGNKDIKLGPQQLWETVDGRDIIKPEYFEIAGNDRAKFDTEYGADDAHWMLMDNPMQVQWSVPTAEPLKQIEDWTLPYTIYDGAYIITLSPGTEEFDNYTKVSMRWGSTLPKLLMAKSDEEFDNLLNEFIKYRNENGHNEIENILNEKFNINKQKLGME